MVQAVFIGRLTESGFDLAWFSSLTSKCLTFFTLPFSELSLVRLVLDLVDYDTIGWVV